MLLVSSNLHWSVPILRYVVTQSANDATSLKQHVLNDMIRGSMEVALKPFLTVAHHTETGQLIYNSIQLTGFYMMRKIEHLCVKWH